VTDSLAPLKADGFSEALDLLDDLVNRDDIAFLFGAGTSYCEDMPLMSDLTSAVLRSTRLGAESKVLLSSIQSLFGASSANIEDYLSEVGDLLAIADRRDRRRASFNALEISGASFTASQLRTALSEIKASIAEAIEACAVPNRLMHHRHLVSALHRPLRPGKPKGRTVAYLLLNYDTFIEDALALEQVPYADGIEGGPNGWWLPETTFSRTDVSAKVMKLHGSIDWWQEENHPLPRRATKRIRDEAGTAGQVLIWPASTKYSETQRDPFAQLLGMARTVINPAKNSSRFLGIAGYSFGDEHINAELEAALKQSEGRLTVAVFTSQETLEGPLKKLHDDNDVSENLLIFGKRGFYHGSSVFRSAADLPWWKFENFARLIAGER